MDKGEKEKTTIKTHEDLVVYQKAFDVAMTIFELSKQYGKQRFKCNNCGRQFVESPTRQPISHSTRELIDQLLRLEDLVGCDRDGYRRVGYLDGLAALTGWTASKHFPSRQTLRQAQCNAFSVFPVSPNIFLSEISSDCIE